MRRSTGQVATALIVLLILLPIAYLLSVGPALWLARRDVWLRERPVAAFESGGFVQRFYAPATYVLRKCEPMLTCMERRFGEHASDDLHQSAD